MVRALGDVTDRAWVSPTRRPRPLAPALWVGVFAVLWSGAAWAAAPRECTPAEAAEWSFIRASQLGLAVRNADTHYIGPVAGRTKASGHPGGRNWYPADVFRHTVCGRLEHWSLFRGWRRELDLHPHITPQAEFAYVLQDTRSLSGSDETKIYGEVTPAKNYQPSFTAEFPSPLPFFSRKVDSEIEGRQVCVYGPWVVEQFHEDVPEIHPIEQLWFVGAEGKLTWLLLQDRSDRFDARRANFCPVGGPATDCETRLPPKFKGWWTSWSTRAAARLAYELPERGAERHIEIRETARGATPPLTGSQTVTDSYGSSLLQVDYPRPGEDLLVKIDDTNRCVVHDGAGARLLGYVSVFVTVHAPDVTQVGEAYRQLEVDLGGWSVGTPLDMPPAPDAHKVAEATAPRLHVEFKDLSAPQHRQGSAEYEMDVAVWYAPSGDRSSGAQAERRNLILNGFDPEQPDGGRAGGARRATLYQREFRGPFEVDVEARDESGTSLGSSVDKCNAARQPSAAAPVVVCWADDTRGTPYADEGELLDVVVRVRDDYAGTVRVSAKVRDPFGGAATREQGLSFPRPAASKAGGLPADVRRRLADTAGTDVSELARLWSLSADAPTAVIPECAARARRARLLHLHALRVYEDDWLSSQEETELLALAKELASKGELESQRCPRAREGRPAAGGR